MFLTDGECPINDSVSERALRIFTIGRKNGLNVYYYIRYLLTELPKIKDVDGNMASKRLEPIMPWSKTLPAECYSKRRK